MSVCSLLCKTVLKDYYSIGVKSVGLLSTDSVLMRYFSNKR